MTPERIQLHRTKGSRKPSGAVNVARPSKWGNPFKLGDRMGGLVHYGPKHLERFGRGWDFEGRISGPDMPHHMHFSANDVVETYVRWATPAEVVELYRLTILEPTPGMLLAYPSAKGHFLKVGLDEIRTELAGKDLACWCSLDQPCHGDVLLQLANEVPA